MKGSKKDSQLGKRRAAIVAKVGEVHQKHTKPLLIGAIILLVLGLAGLGYLAYKHFQKPKAPTPNYNIPKLNSKQESVNNIPADKVAATNAEIAAANQQLYAQAVATLQDPAQQTFGNYMNAATYAVMVGKKDEAKAYIAKAKPLVSKLSKDQQQFANGAIAQLESQTK